MYFLTLISHSILLTGAPVLNGGEQLTVRTGWTADLLECLDKFLLLPPLSQPGVEVRGCQTEEPPVLVRGGA